jgi:hypothetical protein
MQVSAIKQSRAVKKTYTVQVSNSEGGKADAELLTSMYDASLDSSKNSNGQFLISIQTVT